MEGNEELIIKKHEFDEKLVELINNAGLPVFAIRPILIELCNQLLLQEQQQYKEVMKNKLPDKGANETGAKQQT